VASRFSARIRSLGANPCLPLRVFSGPIPPPALIPELWVERFSGIVAIEEVVAGQVFKGRRTSLRAGSALQVFARSRTASEDKDAGHRP